MHFITNGYKRFSKTNSTNPRQRVPLITKAWVTSATNVKVAIIDCLKLSNAAT